MVQDLFILIMGLIAVFKFRFLGKKAMEQQKKLNHILPFFRQPDKYFDEGAVLYSQIMFLIIGLIFTLFGLVRLLD